MDVNSPPLPTAISTQAFFHKSMMKLMSQVMLPQHQCFDHELGILLLILIFLIFYYLIFYFSDFAVDNTGTMRVEEYVDVDEQVATEALLTDKDIVSMVSPNTRDSDDSSDEEPEPVHRVNGKEAITGMEKGLLYMEQGGFTTEEMDYIREMTDRMRALQLKSRSQKKLTDFFL